MAQNGKKPSTSVMPKKIQIKEITCLACGEVKKPTEFYASNSVYNAGTGKVQYCRDCCMNMSCDKNGNIDIERLKTTLEKIDKPFLPEVLQSAYDESKNKPSEDGKESHPLGLYFKNINSLPQYNKLTWKDSKNIQEKESNDYSKNIKFEVTQAMIRRWGVKHEPEDYLELENFYNDMTVSNNIETAQDIVYLKKLAVISLKLDKALQEGNSGEAKQFGDLFSKYMADSKFRAMDKTDADKTGGIRNFGQIYAEVEKDGFIPPWEYYRKIKGITQDIVDKTIMHIENFTLKLNKVEKMTSPPMNTPRLDFDEIDMENTIEINDIEVDETDGMIEGVSNGILE